MFYYFNIYKFSSKCLAFATLLTQSISGTSLLTPNPAWTHRRLRTFILSRYFRPYGLLTLCIVRVDDMPSTSTPFLSPSFRYTRCNVQLSDSWYQTVLGAIWSLLGLTSATVSVATSPVEFVVEMHHLKPCVHG